MMTREEFGILAKTMKAAYTDPKFLPDRDAFNLWYELLCDLDHKTASVAVMEWMQTQRHAPTIADVRDMCATVTQGEELSPMEAWALVRKAIANSAYHYVEEYAKLPPIVQRAVGSAYNLHAMATDEDFNEGVARSNFLRAYETELARERMKRRMTADVRRIVENGGHRIAGGAE